MKQLVNKYTGEVTKQIFATNSNLVEPVKEDPRGERIVDDTLFEPKEVMIDRCERAGLLKELYAKAMDTKSFDFPDGSKVADIAIEMMEFGTGDLSDLQRQKDVLEALGDVPIKTATPVAEQSTEASEEAPKDPPEAQ
uniref:Phage portal protein n=1 Tax=Dulem virus 96 TaxID=3145807 RepID=A0AAU8AUY7_9VIRU